MNEPKAKKPLGIADYIEDINFQRKAKFEDEFAQKFGVKLDNVNQKFFYDLEGDDKKFYEGLEERYKPIKRSFVQEICFILQDGQKYGF